MDVPRDSVDAPLRRSASRANRRQARLAVADLPLAIDVMQFALLTGRTVVGACAQVAQWGPPAWRPAFRAIGDATARGATFEEAVDAAARRHREFERWRDVLVASARAGIAVTPLFVALATAARAEARSVAESRARQMPVRLLLPLTGCVLPAFVCLAVAPAVIGAVMRLRS